MPAAIDLTGQRFGRLVAVGLRGRDKFGFRLWLWRCDCGVYIERPSAPIKAGTQISCGCAHREQSSAQARTHGKSATRTYRAWIEMKARVAGKDAVCARHYTERGIFVAPEWRDFNNFYRDMGECPAGMSLDRVNNNDGYRPGNCRWATQQQQMANTRRSVKVVVDGETMCLKDACRKINVNYDYVRGRIRRGDRPQQVIDRDK